jgi:hypothetical protein
MSLGDARRGAYCGFLDASPHSATHRRTRVAPRQRLRRGVFSIECGEDLASRTGRPPPAFRSSKAPSAPRPVLFGTGDGPNSGGRRGPVPYRRHDQDHNQLRSHRLSAQLLLSRNGRQTVRSTDLLSEKDAMSRPILISTPFCSKSGLKSSSVGWRPQAAFSSASPPQ